MSAFWLEVLAIFALVTANGFFAASEIAVLSTRRTRVAELTRKAGPKGRAIESLKANPERFFATIQIGVTLAGTFASALAGAMAIEYLKPILAQSPLALVARSSEPLAIALVVVFVTILTLLGGELVPKSLAARRPEWIAVRVAPWVDRFARAVAPFTSALSATTRGILRLLGSGGAESPVPISEEEVKLIVREGRDLGIFDATETELIHKVFEFADKSIRKILIPRPRIRAVRLGATAEEVLKVVTESSFMRYPVYGRSLDDIRGILFAKDLFALVQKGLIPPPAPGGGDEERRFDLTKVLRPAHFVPETIKVSQLLKELQKRRIPMAIVLNEFGSVEGLVTVEDLLEEIVGEFGRDSPGEERPVQQLEEGAFLVDASMPVRDLRDTYGFRVPEGEEYQTLAGYLMDSLQKIPRPGETWTHDGLRLTVVDMDGRRISKVRIDREGPQAPPPGR